MATLIPALGACVSLMISGEKRLAQSLEDKLDDDYLLWYDVPMGTKNVHPDFCAMHPRRGVLILEVKDWKLRNICAQVFRERQLPLENRVGVGDFDPSSDKIKVMP